MKVTEIFYTLQGEGRYIGYPTIFIRLFGCNFRCQGYGMEKGKLSNEYKKIDPNKYTSIKDLPLVSTGCDSYASWDPRFKDLIKDYTVDELIQEIDSMGKPTASICITGGEPLLLYQQQIGEFIRKSYNNQITFETNGTQMIKEKYWEHIYKARVTMCISPKLSRSGELSKKAIRPKVISNYISEFGPNNCFFKFVAQDRKDFEEIKQVLKIYSEACTFYTFYKPTSPNIEDHCDVYVMPVGGNEKELNKYKKQVAELCMEYGYKYSYRLQVSLFKNDWGT